MNREKQAKPTAKSPSKWRVFARIGTVIWLKKEEKAAISARRFALKWAVFGPATTLFRSGVGKRWETRRL